MRTELRTVLESVREMLPEELPALLGELEVIRATAAMRLTASPSLPQHDELVDVHAASQRLGVSVKRLYTHHGQYPFTRRDGRKLLFSSLGIDAYIRRSRIR